jgi:hypothetical protein
MRLSQILILSLLVLLAAPVGLQADEKVAPAPGAASKLLPNTLGSFKATSPAGSVDEESWVKVGSDGVISGAVRAYQFNGQVVAVTLITTKSDSSAFALLANSGCMAAAVTPNQIQQTEIGTKSCVLRGEIRFARGPVYVAVDSKAGSVRPEALQRVADSIAATLDKGANDVPVLVKHLPDWPRVSQVSYAVTQETLRQRFSRQPVLDAVSFTGGAEAVVADYNGQRLVIVEFNTASLATDNNQRITAKLKELNAQGQPVPTAYRRVGNYAVFVFDAPSEQAANQLIDQVKYQQVVQWLGENPFAYEQATREFTETTLGVFVSVVKASGLALVTCLAVGGFFGAVLFSFRRAQQRSRDAYSDSDAMLRLNLDELTPENDPARLLRPHS